MRQKAYPANGKISGLCRILLYAVLVFYVLLLLAIVFFKYITPLELFSADRPIFRSVNLIPFHSIKSYLLGSGVSRSVVLNNVLGNILLFIPLGIYLQVLKRDKRIFAGIFFIFAASLSVEVIQYILGIGAADIDDILLNCLGGIVGILCYRLLLAFIKDEGKIKNIIAILGAVIGIPLFCLTILLAVSNK